MRLFPAPLSRQAAVYPMPVSYTHLDVYKRQEQTMICYGVLACLKGLKEQGCNGPVTDALNKLEKYLNEKAHDGDAP